MGAIVTDAQVYLEFLRYVETYAAQRRDTNLMSLVNEARNALAQDIGRHEKTVVGRRGMAVGCKPNLADGSNRAGAQH
jgi:hypothetical protein